MGKVEEVTNENGTKRPRLLGISDMSDDVIGEVFKYLGRGHFLFIAGTSRHFYRLYKTICGTPTAGKTTMRSTVESISRLQWSWANGCPWRWSTRTCAVAAKNGRLEVLQWARENGCPWNECTCDCAARNGHLEVLQ